MKTNVKCIKIMNCPTTTQLKLLHWLMHLELSGGIDEGGDGHGFAHPARQDHPSNALKNTEIKTHTMKNQFTQIH